jgi:acylphosphatase
MVPSQIKFPQAGQLKLGLNKLAETVNGLMAKIKVQVFGKVQGVFFRHSARQQAQSLNLIGWIKNLSDGSVLSEAQGEQKSLLEFIAWCKHGPQRAQVESVSVQWLEDETLPETAGFLIVD